jgi:3-oxoacyl-(acyl-carrier-protein) synthase
VKQAQITSENTAAKDLGVIFSSGIGDLTTIQEQVIKMHEKGPKRVSPMFVLTAIVNMAADNIALRIGAKNICTSAVTACASGTNAIGEAYRQIKEGRAKVMVAGGAEASVNAHGTATKANDAAEAKAINLVFGEDSRVLVGSTKAMTGHLLGAAGAIEAIAVVASLQKGRLPVNIGMTEQDKECKVNVVTQAKAHPEKLEYALSNSLGFGGHNAVLAFRKWS